MIKTYLAPAKINLCLHVLGKRADGYHDLAMLMQRISLYDRITLRLTAGPGVTVRCAGVSLNPEQENIAALAAQRLLAFAGSSIGVDIDIDKQIPVAAGLGGGSSDAATVLMALNEMLDLKLSTQVLQDLGVKLGADVPFFIYGHPAWATGIGDVLQRIEKLPPLWYVLVNPGIAVSTAWAYGNLRLTSRRDDHKIPRFSSTLDSVTAVLHNDLEEVTVGQHSEIGKVKRRLTALGAAGSLMSGSGSTVFGVFAGKAEAEEAAVQLQQKPGWRVFVVHPVDGEGPIKC
ncbi:4-(cytidine 5'-diphospho)-2-C-methyl-D-erythritol kinase [Syntrophotalea acetylenivorans]|uniref:4-diphosphocytidyl-2-C-methyl-D-erythritol kinase n=1 Tax=Syntrophotalea acetylenivorans TaxID=1842532 RepID=A0A1L3GKU0_9BACT|nr:4-(cytidine 5'-diphospho)-2-C-methyl-D-erythritol kinase [Syntrophotalea acetylenivorans]APG26505.1 4-(cytidine 5'-diphospho)-2-C-methyl-D-erythritol kinase [Syntrophotalea acetylenivorans]